jgi:hypothetical protein
MDQPGSARQGRLPWHHLWIVRFGPLGLCALGLALLVVSMTVTRADAIEVAYITLGTVLVIAGILIPRFKGPVEVNTSGVKGELSTIQDLDPRAFAVIGAGAIAPLHRGHWTGSELVLGLTGPIRASDVSIRAILDAAAAQGWTAEPDYDTGRYVLSSENAPEKLLLPGNTSWMATPELLRVLDASGLDVSGLGDKGGS